MSPKLLFLLIASGANAWHPTGHFLTALIAKQELEASRPGLVPKLEALIKQWSQYTKEKDYPFVEAASFPDDIKYLNWKSMNKWHFDDDYFFVDSSIKKEAVEELPRNKQNIIFAINEAKNTLASKKESGVDSLFGKGFQLRYLIHLVADLHQPLHATSMVSKDLPKGDAGGNAFKIDNPGAYDLHTFWDKTLKIYKDVRAPITEKNMEYLEKVAKELKAKYTRKVLQARLAIKSPVNWSRESREFAMKAYKGLVKGKKIPEDYVKQMTPIVNEQLVIGGYRLADLIKEILPDNSSLETKKSKNAVDDIVHDGELPVLFEIVPASSSSSSDSDSGSDKSKKKDAKKFANKVQADDAGDEPDIELIEITEEEKRAIKERQAKRLFFNDELESDTKDDKPFYKNLWFVYGVLGAVLTFSAGVLVIVLK